MLTGYHGHGSFIVSIVRFVSCLAFICNQDSQQWYLLSGGGDSTVSKFLKRTNFFKTQITFLRLLRLNLEKISNFLMMVFGQLACTSIIQLCNCHHNFGRWEEIIPPPPHTHTHFFIYFVCVCLLKFKPEFSWFSSNFIDQWLLGHTLEFDTKQNWQRKLQILFLKCLVKWN